jgi:MOSC domain-containing protein YiiM
VADDAQQPTVISILTAPTKGEPMVPSESIEAVTGKGLAGDRYALGTGVYSGDPAWDAEVTLIQQEAIDSINAEHDAAFTPEMLRRNLVTRNIDIQELYGREFKIGSATFRGVKDWPPCSYIAKLNNSAELPKYFARCAGIGAIVVTSGTIRAGDEIELLDAGA